MPRRRASRSSALGLLRGALTRLVRRSCSACSRSTSERRWAASPRVDQIESTGARRAAATSAKTTNTMTAADAVPADRPRRAGRRARGGAAAGSPGAARPRERGGVAGGGHRATLRRGAARSLPRWTADQRRSALRPGYVASAPSASSMRSSWLYFATRSRPRRGAGLDLPAAGGDGEVGDRRVLGLARAVRHDGRVARVARHRDRVERLGQRADLVRP